MFQNLSSVVFSSYQKISEFPTIDDDVGGNIFDGNGVPYKGKLIGMEDIATDFNEQLCLETLERLKNAVRARGEHKQKVQLNLTFDGVKVIDELTKTEIAQHEIRRISFVVMDPRDIRAFGYIYNTSDERHQFWGIKTERPAHFAVLALRDLFQEAYDKLNNPENNNSQTISTLGSSNQIESPSSKNVSQTPVIVGLDDAWGGSSSNISAQQQSRFNDDVWGDNSSTIVTQQQSEFNDSNDAWGGSSSSTIGTQQQVGFNDDAWAFSQPAVSSTQSARRVENSPANTFILPPPPQTRRVTVTQQPATTSNVSNTDLFSLFSTAPSTSSDFQPQTSSSDSTSVSSITSPEITNTFNEFDLLGDSSSNSTTNDLFFSSSSTQNPKTEN